MSPVKENNWENNRPGAIWVRQRSGKRCSHPWILQTLPEIKTLPVLCVQTNPLPPNRAQTKGIHASTHGSYHMNHSNKVVHLKWGVKRSRNLPRSSCVKTKKTGRCVGTGWWPETGGQPWLRGRCLVSWMLRLQGPGTQISSPVWPIQALQLGPSNVHSVPSAGWGHSEPPPQPGIGELGSRPLGLGLGPPDTS